VNEEHGMAGAEWINYKLVTYCLDIGSRMNSQTGKMTQRIQGPFVFGRKGEHFLSVPTEEDVIEYVMAVHGMEPCRIEFMELPKRRR